MLSPEENELLTETGPGTPGGELFRRYWQPVALSEEIAPGSVPKTIKILGEPLVLFRDDQGRVGLLGLHCSHRGADLSYGRLEDRGIRCIYHGWLYDIEGRCLEQPGEPEGSEFYKKIRHIAYPCVERGRAIFAYLGPGEPPLVPCFPFLALPEHQVMVFKLLHECNYLQGNEGNCDFVHVSFLHYTRYNHNTTPAVLPELGDRLSSRGRAPGKQRMEAQMLEYGVRMCRITSLDADTNEWQIGTFILPNLTAIPTGATNWHVPIDDTHHWKFTFVVDHSGPLDRSRIRQGRAVPDREYRSPLNGSNRYGQDRSSMVADSYSGLGYNFQFQDLCITEGMGPVYDRTREHLGPSDQAIIMVRRLMLRAIRTVQKGGTPPAVFHRLEDNSFSDVVTMHGVFPSTADWKDGCETLVARGVAWREEWFTR